MFRYGLGVSTNQRAAERLGWTEARVVCQSLHDDGKAFAAGIFGRQSGGTSSFLKRHQEREQQG
jgi:hypothetical protein